MPGASEEQCCFPPLLLHRWKSGITDLQCFQTAPQLLKAVTQGCTEPGGRRHCCNDFGDGARVVRLGHDAPNGGGKRSSDGENHLVTPVSFNKTQSALEAYFCMLIKWNCISEKC